MKRITAFLSNLSREAVPNSVETFDGGSGHQLSHFVSIASHPHAT
jgi:hypothetical protein